MGVWAAVALFVVTLRAFIPTGLMLDHTGPDGRLSIVICTAQGVQPLQPNDTHHDGGNQDDGGTQGCVFAVAAHAVFPVLPPPVPAVAVAVPVHHPLPEIPALTALTAPPLPARGPPLSA